MSLWLAKQDVTLQDPTTPTLISNFNQVHNSTILAVENVLLADNITVDDATGIVVGSYIIVFSPITNRVYFGIVIDITGAPNIVLDTQIDSVFPVGSFVDVAIINMNVNGSVTRQIFGLRGTGVIPGVNIEVDITRIIITCYTATPVNLLTFGDLTELVRGIVLRKRDGSIFNIFNVKSNGEIAGIMLDFRPFEKSKPNEGQDGFVARLTFSSQGKLGVVQRLGVGEDLELVIQDDLLLLTLLKIVAEGSFVEELT